MTPTHPPDPAAGGTAQWRGWFDAAQDPAIDAALRDLYDRLDGRVRARGPTCWSSGKCCNFDAYGHRLYVTGLEIAWVLKNVQRQKNVQRPVSSVQCRGEEGGKNIRGLPVLDTGHWTLDTGHASCVFQVDKLCSIHESRPMGCRVFFCQQGTEIWQRELYEEFLGELRRLHDQRSLAYQYMEWRAGLREAATAQAEGLADRV